MRLYAGAISGTSVDGLDLALLDASSTTPRIVDARVEALPDTLASELRALAIPIEDHLDRVARADAALGDFIGHAVRRFVGSRTIMALGSHGQTIRHDPRGQPAYTVQIGDPNRIAEVSGIDTVADFRRRDIAAGGEGAPLVPPFHDALFRVPDVRRVVLNIGGIANVTILGDRDTVRGFDTGPGNALLDAWIRVHRGDPFDRDGAWAAGAEPIPELLARLERDPYLAEPPPKSTGKERYNLEFVRRHLDGSETAAAVQATLAEFTAASIDQAVAAWAPAAEEIVVCGGGRMNADLMRRLRRRASGHASPRAVTATDDLGVDGDAVEAAAFAWLAHRFVDRLPGNAPGVTGAAGPRLLGALYPAARL